MPPGRGMRQNVKLGLTTWELRAPATATNKQNTVEKWDGDACPVFQISTVSYLLVRIRVFIYSAYRDRPFSDYFVPIFLIATAVACGYIFR